MDHFSMREYFQDSNSGGTSLNEAYSKNNSFLANTVRMIRKKKKQGWELCVFLEIGFKILFSLT